MAQEPFTLNHSVASMEMTASGSRISYSLTLHNRSHSHFHHVRITLHDISLSLTEQVESIDFSSLAPELSKKRTASFDSALTAEQLDADADLLFHLQARDEQGKLHSFLLRSTSGVHGQ